MKCFICKKEIQESIRHFILAKNHREKDGFRDFCLTCYDDQMYKEGYIYILSLNKWIKRQPI